MFEARMAVNGLDLLCWVLAGICLYGLYRIEIREEERRGKETHKG